MFVFKLIRFQISQIRKDENDSKAQNLTAASSTREPPVSSSTLSGARGESVYCTMRSRKSSTPTLQRGDCKSLELHTSQSGYQLRESGAGAGGKSVADAAETASMFSTIGRNSRASSSREQRSSRTKSVDRASVIGSHALGLAPSPSPSAAFYATASPSGIVVVDPSSASAAPSDQTATAAGGQQTSTKSSSSQLQVTEYILPEQYELTLGPILAYDSLLIVVRCLDVVLSRIEGVLRALKHSAPRSAGFDPAGTLTGTGTSGVSCSSASASSSSSQQHRLHDYAAIFSKVMRALFTLLQRNQTAETSAVIIAMINRVIRGECAHFLFGGGDEAICEALCARLLILCTSRLANVRQLATQTLFELARANFDTSAGGFSSFKRHTTLALCALVQQLTADLQTQTQSDSASSLSRTRLVFLLRALRRLRSLASAATDESFADRLNAHIETLERTLSCICRLHGSASFLFTSSSAQSGSQRPPQMDLDSLLEHMYTLADASREIPSLRLYWLLSMCKIQAQVKHVHNRYYNTVHTYSIT